jgi:glycosyltransferase involved in cell wall biosynthesis
MSSSYRYAYITAADLSIDNGPGINEREFVKQLISFYGNQVTCVIPFPSKPDNYFDCNIEYVTNHRRHNPIFYFLYIVSTILRVIRLHRKVPFDALIFRLDLLPLEPLVLSKILRIPFMIKKLSGYTGYPGLVRGDMKVRLVSLMFSLPLYGMVVKRAIAADAESRTYCNWQEFRFGLGRGKIRVINNGANLEMFAAYNRDDCKKLLNLGQYEWVVGYVGALRKLRNVDMLVRAFSKVKGEGNLALVLVGDGEDRRAIELLVEAYGLGSHVVLKGSVPYTEIPKYMNSFDVGIDLTFVPMKMGDTVVNASYSQKIPQYLGCGLPVIAWDVEDNRFVHEEKIGALACIGDENDLTSAIESLLRMGHSEKSLMSRRARAYAEHSYSIDQLTLQRVALWDKAICEFKHRTID